MPKNWKYIKKLLEKEGAALIEESISKMYINCDAAWELFDRGVKLCEEGAKIRDGVEEMSQSIQDNSAMAEETSATSEELAAQAVTLNELVQMFELN